TSYRIATQAFEDAGEPPRIRQTQPGQELVLLAKSARGTVALTPNVLDIVALDHEYPGHKIEKKLGELDQFAGQLVTAIMARADFVRNNAELVTGVLRGVHIAMERCRTTDEDVVRFATACFTEDRRRIVAALK